MKSFLIALQFLTILPVKIRSEIKPENFGRSLLCFPIIGMLIGLILASASLLLAFLPDLVKGAFILVILTFITGGIHLDGFADTCDGFYAGRSKEKILQIMRDSRAGVMGAVGVVCLLLLKFTLIVSISQDILWKSLIMMVTFARWSQVLACYTSNYARREGKAKYFVEYAGKREFLVGSFSTVVLFLLLMQTRGIILLALSILPICLLVNYIKKKIGGMTGDTIGATNEIAEVLILLFCLFLPKINI